MRSARDEVMQIPSPRQVAARLPFLVGESATMRQLKASAAAMAVRKSTVMLLGETGSGKEMLARYIHACSDRAGGPFVPVDCSSLTDTLFESELFGHVRGSFTGAVRDSIGFIRSADKGTLFLDEIGELSLNLQAKLLRVIQERIVTPVGDSTGHSVDIRLVVATHRDLEEMVRRGAFRQDLYFRLNVVKLYSPALRERRDDIVPLAEHFLVKLAHLYQEPQKALTAEAMDRLLAYDWPGNVRELGNIIEHAVVTTPSTQLCAIHLPEPLRSLVPLASKRPSYLQRGDAEVAVTEASLAFDVPPDIPAYPPHRAAVIPLEVAQKHLVTIALKAADGHQGNAARMLEIERRRMYRLVRRYGLKHLTRRGT
jgi:DNA-binding NtrC family response regulator